eukprot:SM000011S18951  [mRNA]  locus=s11:64089:66580:- [translate_table: standard]
MHEDQTERDRSLKPEEVSHILPKGYVISSVLGAAQTAPPARAPLRLTDAQRLRLRPPAPQDVGGASAGSLRSEASSSGSDGEGQAEPPLQLHGLQLSRQHALVPAPSLVDLHAHSSCSDGVLSPEELVAEAARRGVRTPPGSVPAPPSTGPAEHRPCGLGLTASFHTGAQHAGDGASDSARILAALAFSRLPCQDVPRQCRNAAVRSTSSCHVKVLALTDHDTMAGIGRALAAAADVEVRILPGIEISTYFTPADNPSNKFKQQFERRGGPVHLLAYFGLCGPCDCGKLLSCLSKVREGRFGRARKMVDKLKALGKPLSWTHVLQVAGVDVAPGRAHIAQALVEQGHVDNMRDAFAKYLHDDGPAYANGAEIAVVEAVKLVTAAGGVAILAHPWTIKGPVHALVDELKLAGLHGIEVFRSDGRQSDFGTLAVRHKLLEVGGSDYHGNRGPAECKLGHVLLPVSHAQKFLDAAAPLWERASADMIRHFASQVPDLQSTATGAELSKEVGWGHCTLDQGKSFRLSPYLGKSARTAARAQARQLGLRVGVHKVAGLRALTITRSVEMTIDEG